MMRKTYRDNCHNGIRKIMIMATVALLVVACGKEKDDEEASIIGKWMMTEFNGATIPTNNKVVYTLESTTSGYISASSVRYNTDMLWTNHAKSNVTMVEDTITLQGSLNKSISYMAVLNVKSLTNTNLLTESTNTLYKNGALFDESGGTVLWSRINKDYYSEDILGMWEGRVTSEEGSEYDDGQLHRWEYLNDGKYIYYSLDNNGQWRSDNGGISDYFVDGKLLCTRWTNSEDDKTVNNEWWEIESIEDGVMKWTSLRQREDGTFYNATFSMTKVQ